MNLLQKGQKLSINFPQNDKLIAIICTIANVYDDRIDVELPQYFMRYIDSLEEGKSVTVKVFSKMGTIDFNAIIINSPLDDVFSLELDYNAIKLTESEDIPVVSAILPLQINFNSKLYNAKTFEISTQNLKFYGEGVYKIGDVFDCKLILPKSYGTISFRATVEDRDQTYSNEFTVSYSNMTENSRQTLLYYMYEYSNDSSQD